MTYNELKDLVILQLTLEQSDEPSLSVIKQLLKSQIMDEVRLLKMSSYELSEIIEEAKLILESERDYEQD